MSKAGSIHLVRGLAKSLGPNIRVNAVAPGLILTEWADRFPPEVKENWKEATALKHVPYTEDIAQTYSECHVAPRPSGGGAPCPTSLGINGGTMSRDKGVLS